MKLDIPLKPVIPSEEIAKNIEHSRSVGLPFVECKNRPPLALVGGGHSVTQHIEELKSFPGDVWVIGSAFTWAKSQGIRGAFFSCHASIAALKNIEGVEHAIVATATHPQVLAKLPSVQLFDLVGANGVTSATCVPMLAVSMGYTNVSFFGCDSSYHGSTHVYMNERDDFMMEVECAGEKFITGAEFLAQAEFMSAVINAAPGVFKNRSGGLLEALIENKDYDVVRISRKLHDSIVVPDVKINLHDQVNHASYS